jgi:hypothetical protein
VATPLDAACVLCGEPSTHRLVPIERLFVNPEEPVPPRLPPIYLCDPCTVLNVQGRAPLGWCYAGGHWGRGRTRCRPHGARFARFD